MNKRSYVLSVLIIVGMLYSMAIGSGGGPVGSTQSGMGRIGVLTDDWSICSDVPFEITNELISITNGDMLWNRTYGGVGFEKVYAMIQTADGGYALAGRIQSYGADDMDAWLVKTDASGVLQWNRTYGGSSYDEAYSVIQTSDGGYTLAGGSHSDAWLVKTDTRGDVEWTLTYGGSEDDKVRSVIQTADGGYALAGYTQSYGAGGYDAWLVKTDASGAVQWMQTYGGAKDGYAFSGIQTVDGGFALVGYTHSYGGGYGDFWLVKTDAQGEMQWQQTYDGGGDSDWASAVIQTSDGGFALAGETRSYGAGDWDFWLVKTDAHGEMQWQQTYGGSDWDEANAVIQTADAGFVLAGYTGSFGAGGIDAWLVKTFPPEPTPPALSAPTVTVVSPNGGEVWYDMQTITWIATNPQGDPLTYTVFYSPDGGQTWIQLATGLAELSYLWDTTIVEDGASYLIKVEASDGMRIGVDISNGPFEIANEPTVEVVMQWQLTYGGAGYARAVAGIQTADGGFAFAGETSSTYAGDDDFYLVKTDAHGTMEWQQTYGGAGHEWAQAVIQTADDGFALAGWTESYGSGINDFYLVKTDAHGTMEWHQTYGGAGNEGARAVIQTVDGGFALAGWTTTYGAGINDFYLVKTNAHGTMEWQQTYGGAARDVANAVIQTADGGFALAGETRSYGAGDDDFYLVKTNAHGTMEWQQTYGSMGYEKARAMIQVADGGFALAGMTGRKTGILTLNGDVWLVKTDTHGTMEWQQTYGGAEHDEANVVIQTADGGFALFGRTGDDAWLVKTFPPETTPPEFFATTSTTTGTATDTATTDTPAAFIPGFTLVELVLALTCLVVLTRRITKR